MIPIRIIETSATSQVNIRLNESKKKTKKKKKKKKKKKMAERSVQNISDLMFSQNHSDAEE